MPRFRTPIERVDPLHCGAADAHDTGTAQGERPCAASRRRAANGDGDLVSPPRPASVLTLSADCKQCSQATISNLIIDGNRPQLLRVPRGEALIETGNAYDQKVTGCRLFEPRGWSALHVREGDELNCRRAYIADNEIVRRRRRTEKSTRRFRSMLTDIRGRAERSGTTSTMAS